jgi:zinc finger FYVE domain-containing protein 1
MVSSSIMHPTDRIQDFPDLVAEFESLSFSPQSYDDLEDRGKSFAIIDSQENFLASDLESFRKKLGLSNIDTKLKVVSIFGNSGDGKSHTMNNVFFDGEEVFKMSSEQNSCTMGVNCYYQKFFYKHEILCIDTEGLQGVTQNENQQHRMLMKVLAISDIIIYRTRAERLNIDMYKFLATASKTFLKHFSPMLHAASMSTAKGPDVIIFHETHNTRPLTSSKCAKTSSMMGRVSSFFLSFYCCRPE